MKVILDAEREALMERYNALCEQTQHVYDENKKEKLELDQFKTSLDQREARLSSKEEDQRYYMMKEQQELEIKKVIYHYEQNVQIQLSNLFSTNPNENSIQ